MSHETDDNKSEVANLWRAFKERLSSTENTTNFFHLHSLLHMLDGLDTVEVLFPKEVILEVMKEFPTDKFPGPYGFFYEYRPYGFNRAFIKSCWHIIVEDMFKQIQYYYDGSVNHQSVNSAIITLIPQKDNHLLP